MGQFPDYNSDGSVNVLDIVQAPAARKEEILELIKNDSWQGKDFSIGEKARSSELLMQSSGALTANPLPSMPSISNVGAAPFSGSINWNAIPGGFQPLPQTAGGKKKLYQYLNFMVVLIKNHLLEIYLIKSVKKLLILHFLMLEE